jgi:hypothetical protein
MVSCMSAICQSYKCNPTNAIAASHRFRQARRRQTTSLDAMRRVEARPTTNVDGGPSHDGRRALDRRALRQTGPGTRRAPRGPELTAFAFEDGVVLQKCLVRSGFANWRTKTDTPKRGVRGSPAIRRRAGKLYDPVRVVDPIHSR